MTYRILIDKDSVVYDLSTPWYAAHNRDWPDHELCVEHVDDWDTAAQCRKAGCNADVYSYFHEPSVWSDGPILGKSDEITREWKQDFGSSVDIGFLTTAANPMAAQYSWEWLKKYFPHITNIMIVNTHIKHWVNADILIDDGIHNLTNFDGIAILYSQYWNVKAHDQFIVAKGNTDTEKWIEVNRLVRKAIMLLEAGFTHSVVNIILRSEKMIGVS